MFSVMNNYNFYIYIIKTYNHLAIRAVYLG